MRGGRTLRCLRLPRGGGPPGPGNQLVFVDQNGSIEKRVPLPADVAAQLGGQGLEGDEGRGDHVGGQPGGEGFAQGGWLGKGPGEGTVKRILPDAHTDFIFAVTAEEFGVVVCMVLVAMFAIIVLRALFVAQRAEDPFVRLAVTGLALLFGIQAAINMMVNLHMMPAKGMTLPFISYGGSSLISLALGTGFLLALTRKRPRAENFGQTGRRQ